MRLLKFALFISLLTCHTYGMEYLRELVFGPPTLINRLKTLGLELPLDPENRSVKPELVDLSRIDFSPDVLARNREEFDAAHALEVAGNIDVALRSYLHLTNQWDINATEHLKTLSFQGNKRFGIVPDREHFIFFHRWEHIKRELGVRNALTTQIARTGSYGPLVYLARERGLLPEGYDDIGVPSVRLPNSPSPATEVLEEASSPRRGSGASNGSGDSDVTTVAGPSVVDPTHVEPEADSEEETESLLPAAEAPPADPSLLGLRKRIVGNG